MAEIRWDLLNPVDTGAQVQQGFATGMAMVKQVQSKNALRAYLANPDDPQAYNALAYYDPQAASVLQQQRAFQNKQRLEQQALAVRRAAGQAAASGDIAGAKNTALAGGDFELVDTLNKMGDDERKKTLDKYIGTAPIAYQTAKLPYERRKEYIQSAAPELKALGWTDEQLSSFDPTDAALASIVGTGSKLSELQAADKPQIVPYVPGGGVAMLKDGQLSTLIAPNPGDKETGAPVVTSGGAGGSVPGANNPGALRKPGSKQFQSFATPQEGIQAQEAQLGRYMSRGLNTVRKIVETYAPRQSVGGDNSDASVNNYIEYAAHRIGVNPDDALSSAIVPKLAAAMREFETGKRSNIAAIGNSVDKAKVKADALEAIALGADPEKVKAAAASHGVSI